MVGDEVGAVVREAGVNFQALLVCYFFLFISLFCLGLALLIVLLGEPHILQKFGINPLQ